MAAPQITIDALTTAPRDGAAMGSGTFDVLIRALKEHLHEEYEAGRVVGREFATLYLGAIQSTLAQASDFVFRTQQMNLDAQLKDQQLALGAVEIQKSTAQLAQIQAQTAQIGAQTLLIQQQKLNAETELLILTAQKDKIITERELLIVQRDKIASEIAHLDTQTINLGKQGAVLDVQVQLTTAQKDHTIQQVTNLVKQGLHTDAETANLVAQKDVIQQQYRKLIQDTELVIQQNNVAIQQVQNAMKERDLLSVQILKVGSERDLIGKKIITEQAQYSGDGVSTDSVIGRQKELFRVQAEGFLRDAEQKAVKILVDTWNVRRTTDEGTVADATNKLHDAAVGAGVVKLMAGIGVPV